MEHENNKKGLSAAQQELMVSSHVSTPQSQFLLQNLIQNLSSQVETMHKNQDTKF